MKINSLREDLNSIDLEIIGLLQKRFAVCLEIAKEKTKNKANIINEGKRKEKEGIYKYALGSFGVRIYSLIHKKSIKIQTDETTKLHI